MVSSNVPLAGVAPLRELAELPVDVTLSASLPDWARRATEPPFSIKLRTRGSHAAEDPSLTQTRFGEDEYSELSYDEGARFIVDRAATRIWGTWSAPLTIEDATTFLVGPVLGFALRRRGVTAFHASSFRIHGHAIALCGESEAGKSTTAACLSLVGFPVLAEDILAIRFQGESFLVEPGYPRVCLWPDSVANLFGSSDALPRLTPTWDKHYLLLDADRATFASEPLPLGAIYLLAPRSDEHAAPYIEELSQQEALLSLVQNTYMNWLLDRSKRAAEFDHLAQIVAAIPVRRITPHSDAGRIDTLCDLIVRDAESLLAPDRALVA